MDTKFDLTTNEGLIAALKFTQTFPSSNGLNWDCSNWVSDFRFNQTGGKSSERGCECV